MTAADWISDRRALIDAATEGPWQAVLLYGADYGDGSSSYRGGVHIAQRPGSAPVFNTSSIDARDAALIADSRTSLPKAVDALESVLELANGWTARGEHLMTYSKTVPEEIGTSLLEAGADFVERARILRNTLTTALGVES